VSFTAPTVYVYLRENIVTYGLEQSACAVGSYSLSEVAAVECGVSAMPSGVVLWRRQRSAEESSLASPTCGRGRKSQEGGIASDNEYYVNLCGFNIVDKVERSK
jgi:hypothetical protein